MHALAFTFAISVIRVILKFLFGEFYFGALGYSFVLIISFGLVLLLGTRGFKEDRRLFFRKMGMEAKPVFEAIGLTFVLCLFCLTLGESEEMLRNEFDDNVRFGWDLIMRRNFLSVLFVAPVIEELFFRGFLLPGLAKSHSRIYCIGVTSFIFLLFHLSMEDVTSVPFFSAPLSAVIFSLLLSWLMLVYNNIWLCILLHFLWNLFCYVIPLLIGLSRLPLNNPRCFWVFSFVITASCVVLTRTFVQKLQLGHEKIESI